MMDSTTSDFISPLQMEMTIQALSPPPRHRRTITPTSSLITPMDSGNFPFPFTNTARSSTERFVLKPRALTFNRSPITSTGSYANFESPMLVEDEESTRYDYHRGLNPNDRMNSSKGMDINEDVQFLQVLGRVNNLMRSDSTGSIPSASTRRHSCSAPSA